VLFQFLKTAEQAKNQKIRERIKYEIKMQKRERAINYETMKKLYYQWKRKEK
jgi:hypothetical protein